MSFLRPVLPAPLIKSRPRPLRDPNSMLSSIKNLSRPPLFRPQVSRAAVEDRPLATAPRLRDMRAQRHYSDTLDWPMRGRLIKKEAGWASLRWLVFVAAMVSALGCKPANTPRAVVDRFIEAHYVAINLKSSERWCTGLALDKLHKEEALTLGQAIDDETRKPADPLQAEGSARRSGPRHVPVPGHDRRPRRRLLREEMDDHGAQRGPDLEGIELQ